MGLKNIGIGAGVIVVIAFWTVVGKIVMDDLSTSEIPPKTAPAVQAATSTDSDVPATERWMDREHGDLTHAPGYYYFSVFGNEWVRVESEAKASELIEAERQVLQYQLQQSVRKDAAADLELQTKLLMLEKGIPIGGRYSSEIRTDAKGNSYYSDNQGNYIICRVDGQGKQYCSSQ